MFCEALSLRISNRRIRMQRWMFRLIGQVVEHPDEIRKQFWWNRI
jgi:hypothetical protein